MNRKIYYSPDFAKFKRKSGETAFSHRGMTGTRMPSFAGWNAILRGIEPEAGYICSIV